MNLQTFLAIIQLVRTLMPEIIAIIQIVEAALPQNGQGAAKLEIVRSTLASAYGSINQASITFDQLWPTLQVAITGLVAAYNAAGTFKKSS